MDITRLLKLKESGTLEFKESTGMKEEMPGGKYKRVEVYISDE